MPSASTWSEYTNAEGRTYWSNSETKQSVWEKPEELKTPFEREMAKTDWKQYLSKGRPYYVNSITRETKWELPEDLAEIKERLEKKRSRTRSRSPDRDPRNDDRALQRYRSASPASSEEELEVITMPPGGFPNEERAEEGFIYLLKREKIDETWTWDQAMRKIITDPLYKALDTQAKKRAVFEKYTGSIVAERQAEKEARIAKIRPVLIKLFRNSQQIKSFSTIKTADRVFARDRHWRDAKPDEKRLILEEYTTDLRKREEDEEKRLRQANAQALGSLIRDLDINVATPWRSAHKLIVSSPAFERLQKVDTIDVLNVFDDYTRQLEQEADEDSRRYRAEQVRRGRKARDGFKALLSELETQGQLKRNSKWKDTLPLIRDDDRYNNLLGLPGSSPLDLWMDAVDDLGEEIERAAAKLERIVKIEPDMTFDQYEDKIKSEQTHIDAKLRREAFDLVKERMALAAADEARRAERKRRHRIDDLRYALKKVSRHLDVDMSYEEAVPHMKDLPEFKDVSDEEDRKAAFEKYIKRQKEKLREEEQDRRRDEKRDDRRRDRRHTPDENRDHKRPRVSKEKDEVEEGEI